MNSEGSQSSLYPLLEHLLQERGLERKGIYTIADAAQIFGVVARTIQEWCREGKLPARNLPGRGRFLSEDIERFLRDSVRKAERLDHEQSTFH